ncbi:zinc ribbon domain-containing protein [Cytobacillus massiliigabonensis]|uniref:zinc ribbon domain-containing protein n=1 Tax=Cytobacillus massiliigabonensis TaxID=1871011 RepID=UPI000C842264|nr:hypothetical protein [Cytobacillus massiliigabonensis]
MICKNCKTPLRAGAGFCSECGAQAEENNRQPLIRPFSKKLLILIGTVILLIAAAAVLYIIGNNSSSPVKLVNEFKQAVNKKDAEKITSLLHSSVSDWTFQKSDAELLLAYFSEQTDDKNELFKRLDKEAAEYEENQEIYRFDDEPFAAIALKQEGKKWLFFHKYSLQVVPVYLRVKVNKDDAKIFINGKKIEDQTKADDYQTYGPFSIGTHEIKAVIEGKYVDAEEKKEVVLYEVKNSKMDESISIQASTVEASTFYEDTSLYINGQKTEMTLGSAREEIGILPTDGSVTFTLEKEFPWGLAKSDEFAVTEKYINMNQFTVLSPEQQEEIMTLLNENWSQHTEALQTADTSKMMLVPEEYKESVKKSALQLATLSEKYTATFIQARYDMESIKMPIYNEDKNRYELKVEAEYTLLEPQLHNYSLLRDGDKATTTFYMSLYYDEKESKWKIEDYADGSFFLRESNEIKTFEIS